MHISISRLLLERWPFDKAFSPAELATQQGCHLPPEIFHISFFHSVLLPPSPGPFLYSCKLSGKTPMAEWIFPLLPFWGTTMSISIILDRSYISRPPLSSLYCLLFVYVHVHAVQCKKFTNDSCVTGNNIFTT